MSTKKYLIGLTGNIATGKSTVLRILKRLGARGIDADALVHQLMAKGTPVWQAILDEFGEGILGPEGEIDREKLGAIVFAKAEALKRLEAIVHPAVTARVDELIRQATEPVVVVEAIKLIEAGWHRTCDALWVVTCPREQQLERLMRTRKLSREEALLRIEAQPPQEDKVALADVVIDNSGSLQEMREQVEREWEKLFAEGSRRSPGVSL
ncbi:MAG TPA: dephospho-CoA kinase [Anaerolineae bacterium]|nr:dephospho-CoA kinase [Anaerolineae bacterium]